MEVGVVKEKPRLVEDTTTPIVVPARIDSESHSLSFDQLLLNSIDEALKHLFNDAAVGAIYFYLKIMCQLPLEEIPSKSEAFSSSIHKLLGSGASVIEEATLKLLYSELNLKLAREEGHTFPDYINELRHKYKPT